MKIEYIRNLNGSFMILKEADYQYENYELLMLLNNKIPGLLALQIMINDGKIEYWYDITGMTSMDTMFGFVNLDAGGLRHLTEDIFDMNLGLENYLLDAENVCYLPEVVFYDRSSEKYRFCYLPGSKAEASYRLQSLTEYLLTKIDHTDQAAVKIGYALYEQSTREGCSIQELLSCTVYEETEGSYEDDEVDIMQDDEAYMPDELKELSTKRTRTGIRQFLQRKKTEKKGKSDYRDALRAEKSCEWVAEPVIRKRPTASLRESRYGEPMWLRYQGDGEEEDFLLGEEDFLIGKQSGNVAGILRADTVSRVHAKVVYHEGEYYLEDLNSTNGTYVNGTALAYHEMVKLQPDDRILFATEEYSFTY